MKYILMLILVAPILYLAFRQKKWYLYLMFAMIGFLPEQFALSLHEKLPLLSVNRLLILLSAGFWLWKRWRSRKVLLPVSLTVFLIANIGISLINLPQGLDELNRILLFVLERAMVVVIVADLVENREELGKCVDFMILGAAVTAIIAIVQTVWDYDIASVLHLVKTTASVSIADRMNLTRAYGTYNAISFGCYCAMMLLFTYFRLESTKKQYYSIPFALLFVAMVCTLTRSAWLCFAGAFGLLILVRKFRPVVKLLPSMGLVIALCVALCFAQPKLYKAFVETGKSTLNTVLEILPGEKTPNTQKPTESTPTAGESTELTQQEEKPSFQLDDEFGKNASDPTGSRTRQWSAVTYMAQEGKLLFGYGYNSYFEGKLHYLMPVGGKEVWKPAHAVDVGFVSQLTESGIVGFGLWMLLLGYIFVVAWRKKSRGMEMDYYKLTLVMIPLYLMLNVMSSFLNKSIVWLFIALFYASTQLDGHRDWLQLPKEKTNAEE